MPRNENWLKMSKVTHIVIAYDHTSKTFSYDDDGTRVWIRDLFYPESNTWSDEDENWIDCDDKLLIKTINEFQKLIEGKNQ